MNLSEKEACYILSEINTLGVKAIARLKNFTGSFAGIFDKNPEVYLKSGLISDKQETDLKTALSRISELKEEQKRYLESGIDMICILDETYPRRLKNIADPPILLFVRGRLPEDDVPAVSIIGARQCSDYGISVAEFFAGELAKKGVNVISGLAYGIDAAAARGALKAGEDSYAVLGSGVNVCYPMENIDLFRLMSGTGKGKARGEKAGGERARGKRARGERARAEGTRGEKAGSERARGGVISEFPPKRKALALNFVMRNRLIAGFCDALLVIEAREKSGTSITVGYALDQGKEVFALPGRITDPLGRGCNKLIRDGATPLIEPGDVLSYLGIGGEADSVMGRRDLSNLTGIERLIYDKLSEDPMHVEDIAHKAEMDLRDVSVILSGMELKKYVVSTGGAYYKKA